MNSSWRSQQNLKRCIEGSRREGEKREEEMKTFEFNLSFFYIVYREVQVLIAGATTDAIGEIEGNRFSGKLKTKWICQNR
jgi:hypothetical protein